MLQTVRILVKTIEANLIWRTFSIIHIANVNRLVTPITLGDRRLGLLGQIIFCHLVVVSVIFIVPQYPIPYPVKEII